MRRERRRGQSEGEGGEGERRRKREGGFSCCLLSFVKLCTYLQRYMEISMKIQKNTYLGNKGMIL